jgi:hypothetical protein
MHGEVGAPFLHGDFEFLDEQPLAADLRQRPVEDLVAARRHAEYLDRTLRVQRRQTRLDVHGLP